MKKILISLSIGIVPFIIMYLAVSFFNLSFNFLLWSPGSRLLIIVLSLPIGIGLFITNYYYLED